MRVLRDRKGVELAFDSIIIAALVLMVLVIIVLIVTGTFARILPDLNRFTRCEGHGGVCKDTCARSERSVPKLGECGDDNEPNNCCIPKG